MDVLDREQLLDSVDGDPELLTEIVDLFLESSREILEAIRNAVRRAESEALHQSAHKLKGALANVGARAAAEAAAHLETQGRRGSMTGLEDGLASLESEMQRLEPALRELVHAHGA